MAELISLLNTFHGGEEIFIAVRPTKAVRIHAAILTLHGVVLEPDPKVFENDLTKL